MDTGLEEARSLVTNTQPGWTSEKLEGRLKSLLETSSLSFWVPEEERAKGCQVSSWSFRREEPHKAFSFQMTLALRS